MKLTALNPRWLTDHLFIFRCPHCRDEWLICKDVPMKASDQCELVLRDFPEAKGKFVCAKDACSWKFSGRDFSTLTVFPSIDASKSGHWHGWIKGGEIA